MLVDKYIPNNINEVIDQTTPKKVFLSIANNPLDSPKIITVTGPKGTGKTCLAKCFAKALACRNKSKKGDACCVCDDCLNRLVIYNYNGNKIVTSEDLDSIKKLSDLNLSYYHVVLIEEIDRVSFKLQQELLEVIENSNKYLFFVLITEDKDSIIASIKNRGMIVELSKIDNDELKNNIIKVANLENISIDDSYIDKIVYRSDGNMRLAYMLLDKYRMLDRELFDSLLLDTRINLIKFLAASFIQNKDRAAEALSNIMNSPLSMIKKDYESLILELMKNKTGVIKPSDEYINALYKVSSNRMLDLFNILNSKLIYDMFNNETELQSAMWYIYISIGKLLQI